MKLPRIFVALGLLVAAINFSPTPALAEDCPVIDLSKMSFGNPSPSSRWKNSDPVRVVTWASNATFIEPDLVTTAFTKTEDEWLQQAFDNYGEILDSVAFQRVETPDTANILIGYTMLSKGKIPTDADPSGNFGLLSFNSDSQKGGILLLDPKLWPKNFPFYQSQKTFILPIQNEIGNMLGVPDVNPFGQKQSLVTIYDASKLGKLGQLKINDFDAAVIRQIYGESTCTSRYSTDARFKNLAADKIAGQQYLVTIGASTYAPAKAAEKLISIKCVKGKLTKQVIAAKPKCPSGYKKK